jgi:hypothetical protein
MNTDQLRMPKRRKHLVQPSRRAVLAARLATVGATVTVAAFGPGLALAEARIVTNHNEVMATCR